MWISTFSSVLILPVTLFDFLRKSIQFYFYAKHHMLMFWVSRRLQSFPIVLWPFGSYAEQRPTSFKGWLQFLTEHRSELHAHIHSKQNDFYGTDERFSLVGKWDSKLQFQKQQYYVSTLSTVPKWKWSKIGWTKCETVWW